MSDDSDNEDGQEEKYRFHLPHVKSFEDANKNFEEISESMTSLIHELRQSVETNNKNIVDLAKQISDNIDKLSSQITSVVTSQTMVFVMFFIAMGMIVVVAKGIWNAFFGPIA